MPTKAPATKKPKMSPLPGSAWGTDPAYTVADAALAIGISRKSLYDYIASKRIDHVSIGGQLRVRRSHIEEFIAKGTVKAV